MVNNMNTQEELDSLIYHLEDYGYKETNWVFSDGIFEITLKKGKKKIRIELDVYCD